MSDGVKGIGTFRNAIGAEAAYALRDSTRMNRISDTLLKKEGIALTQRSRDADPEAVQKAATDFEGLLVKQMLDSMWSTVHTKDQLLGSKDEETYRDMFNEALASTIAEGSGIGVKEVITRELQKRDSRS